MFCIKHIMRVCACEQYRSVLGKVTCVYSGCAAVRFIAASQTGKTCFARSLRKRLFNGVSRPHEIVNCISSLLSPSSISRLARTITLCCTSDRTLSPAACVFDTQVVNFAAVVKNRLNAANTIPDSFMYANRKTYSCTCDSLEYGAE